MTLKHRGFWFTVGCLALATGLSAQRPAPPAPAPAPQKAPDDTVFRVMVDAVTTDVIVKDERGQFVSNLSKEDFEVYEDGVKQEIASMTMSHGGRVTNVLEAPPPAAPEGIILPPVRRVNDTSGRIFLFFVDDLHLQFQASGRVRELFKKIGKNLLHEGDLFGIVSSGPSSIAIDMTYDQKRLDDAIKKIAGDGLKPSEIINSASGAGGPTELRHRAHVAFSTMTEALQNLEKVHNRRKALVWVSEGYDFNPFQDSRLGLRDPSSPFMQNQSALMANQVNNPDGTTSQNTDPLANQQKQSETFSDADLAAELGDITRAANRANTTIYTIDPRGLIALERRGRLRRVERRLTEARGQASRVRVEGPQLRAIDLDQANVHPHLRQVVHLDERQNPPPGCFHRRGTREVGPHLVGEARAARRASRPRRPLSEC